MKRRQRRAGQLMDGVYRVPFEALCRWCGGLLVADDPVMSKVKAFGNPRWHHRRKYCGRDCRTAARRFHYRVAKLTNDPPYRVAEVGDAALAAVALGLMKDGWILTREPLPGGMPVFEWTMDGWVLTNPPDSLGWPVIALHHLLRAAQEASEGRSAVALGKRASPNPA
jgi:hypothetical protein